MPKPINRCWHRAFWNLSLGHRVALEAAFTPVEEYRVLRCHAPSLMIDGNARVLL